jgi:hypothetical protein
VSVPRGGSGLLLVARLCRAARYRMSRTRQSLPPLYERESSSRLECLAVSVLLLCSALHRGVCARWPVGGSSLPVSLQCFVYYS